MPLTIHDKPNTKLFHELSRELISAGKSFRFRAVGASMAPAIRDGEMLRVERVCPEKLTKGDIVLFHDGANFRAHRLVKVDRQNSAFVTRGDASIENDASICAEQIVGKVIAKEEYSLGTVRIISLSGTKLRTKNRIKHIGVRVARMMCRTFAPHGLRAFMKSLPQRSLPFLLLAFIAFPIISFGQVAFDNSAFVGARLVSSGTTTITVPLTVGGGTNRLLVVGISINRANNTGVTVNTVKDGTATLISLGSENDGTGVRRIEMFYLLNPPSGANSIVATFNGLNTNNVGAVVGAASFTDVNQTTPFGTFTAANGVSGTNPTLNVTSGVGEMVIDTLAIAGNRTATAGAGQTARWNRNDGNNNAATDVYGLGSTEAGAATVTMSETINGGNSSWALGAVSINQAPPTFTIPATVAGTNNVLIVGVSMNITGNTGATVASVTYNGVALTLAGSHNDAGSSRRVEIWYLVAPATGTNNVVVNLNLPGGTGIIGTIVGATNVSGADQTSPIRDFISADGAAGAISTLNVPSANGDTVVDTLAIAGTDSVTAYGPTQTQVWASASGAATTDVYGSGSTRSGAPSVPLSETFNANSNWSLAAVSVRPFQADLAISVSGNSVSFPANVTYSILVVNNGPTAATGVTMTDTLPTGLTFSSVTGTGCSNVGSAVTCNIGTLASGGNSSISIVATPSAGGGYADTANVTGTITDLDTGNNSAIGIAYSQLNVCTVPASPAATALTGVINTYYPGTASVAAGATSITLGAATGATPIASGDEILIIQMQDAAISSNNDGTYGDGSTGSGWTNLNNAGIYEFATATSAVPLGGGTLTVTGAGPGGGLLFGYNSAAATGTQGQRTFQVVRVPHYTTATLGTGLTASAWNGSTGGIFAVDTSGALTLAGQTVTVDGLGFRGGAGLQLDGGVAGSSTNDYRQASPTTYPAGPAFTGVPVTGIDGSKGEGIAGTSMWLEVANTPLSTGVDGYPNGSMGRGAPGNAGGGGTDANTANDQNSGGGGGANGGAGGFGGDAWNSNLSVGGLGGSPFPSSSGRVVMGGGGGAGSRNNSNNNTAGAPTRIAQASSGAAGGGIIIVRAGSITGTGTMSANGSDAYNLTSNDAGGGGGAGGTIIVLSNAGAVGTLTTNAHGGRGGDAWDDDAAAGPPLADRHGPGGGGGGGVVMVSAAATINVLHGAHGTTLPAPGQYQYGATDGSDGTSATNISYGSTPGPHFNASCTDVAVTKTAPATAFVGNTFAYTLNITNNGTIAATTVQLTDTLPAGVTFSSVTPTAICAQASGTVTCNIANLAASGSQPVTINVVAAAAGTVTNTATVTESQADYDLANNSASATTTITTSADVSITKTAPSSVIEGTNFTYTLTVTNSGPSPATGVVVSDTLPAGVTFVSVTGTGCSQTGGTVTCNTGTLTAAPAAGSSATIAIAVQAGSPANVTNTATVTSSVSDPNSANNTSSATTTITFPTSVRLETFTASSNSDGVLLAWKTGAEQHNLGFNVYREQNGQRVKLNPALIAGSALIFRGGMFNQDVNGRASHHSGKSYAWIDHTASTPGTWYWLEDIDVDGTHTMHGPVSVTQAGHSNDAKAILTAPTSSFVPQTAIVPAETMAQVNSTIAASMPNVAGSHVMQKFWSRKTQQSSVQQIQFGLAAGPAVKILVDHEGWYRVTQPQLAAAGLGVADPRTLQLYAEGVEQPISITGASNGSRGFGPGAAIEFYGTGINTPYSGRRVYWLVNGTNAGKRIAEVSAFGHSGPQPQSFEQTIELQQRTTYFAALLRSDTDNFFGALVSSTPVDQVLTVTGFAPGTGGNATLEIALQGAPAGTTHDVQISFNGTNVGDLQFLGEDEGKISLDIPLGLLQNGDNTVTLTAQDGDTDLSLVDYLRLTYPHIYSADSDSLKCTAHAGDNLVLSGFTQSQVNLLDITNPDSPVLVSSQVHKAGGSYTLDAQVPWSSSGAHTLLAVANDQIAQPLKLIANSPSTWHDRQAGAEYVVISSSQFVNQAQALAQLHSRQGTSVALVTVEDLYDEFNFGERSPYAIRQFLKTATSVWRNKPKYLLLVGDASIDPRDFLGLGFFDFVPTAIVPTAELKTASDDWFSDFNDTGYAQIATGRVAVRTADEAQLVISKIVNYETDRQAGSWRNQVVLVADQDDGPDTFTEQAQTLQSLLPSFMQATDIFVGNLGSTVASQDLLNALNNGALLVNYNGHGSVEVWSPDNFMDDTIAATLTNGSHLPMFIIMNCLNGYFHDVYTQSLAESLMLVPNGGAVAVWASSGLTDAAPQFQMDQLAVSDLFSSGIAIGDAVQTAKQGIADSDVRRTFILFGDPMMHLQLQPASNTSSLHR